MCAVLQSRSLYVETRVPHKKHLARAARPCKPLDNQLMEQPHNTAAESSLIEYPCHFPIKVMGANVEGFVAAMVLVARNFDSSFAENSVEQRPSKAGNYLGLTLSVHVTSRVQLDELYRTLTTHPMVKIVL